MDGLDELDEDDYTEEESFTVFFSIKSLPGIVVTQQDLEKFLALELCGHSIGMENPFMNGDAIIDEIQ